MKNQQERAGTVEFDATVNGKEMYAYYAAGCCGLRTFYGLGGKYGNNAPTPAEVIEGIVTSGVSGNIMVFTDAYTEGEALRAFKAFIDENGLGYFMVSESPVSNIYTSAPLWTGVFHYTPSTLVTWLNKARKERGEGTWEKPSNWYTALDKVHMDSVFYQGGGRPKPADAVNQKALEKAFGEGKDDSEMYSEAADF